MADYGSLADVRNARQMGTCEFGPGDGMHPISHLRATTAHLHVETRKVEAPQPLRAQGDAEVRQHVATHLSISEGLISEHSPAVSASSLEWRGSMDDLEKRYRPNHPCLWLFVLAYVVLGIG